MSHLRTRWTALGAAVAVTLGSGERTAFVPITPCRLADTRPGADNRGPRSTPIGPGQTYTLGAYGAVGDCNLTNLATGLALNVTALNQTQPTFLTIFPSGVARPLTSNLNPAPGQPPTPNAVTVDLNPTGQFDIYNLQGNTDVIVDVVGYYEDHHHDDRYYTKAQIDATDTRASFANASAHLLVPSSGYVEAAKLSDAGQGGAIVTTSPGRLIVNGAVTIGESGATASDSTVRCKLQVALLGSSFVDLGMEQATEVEGNSNHDEKAQIALGAGVGLDPGTFDVRIVCANSSHGGNPYVQAVAITALIVIG